MNYLPRWIESAVGDFAKSAGLGGIFFNGPAAVFRFDNGITLRIEYSTKALVVALDVLSPETSEAAQYILAAADPFRSPGFSLRSGMLANPSRAVLAAVLAPSEISSGEIDRVFRILWSLMENLRRRIER